jgi:glutamyl-tRNA synthetase
VAHHLSHHLGKLGVDPATGPDLVEVVMAQRERAKTLAEMAQNSMFFYRDFDQYDTEDAAAHLKPEAGKPLTELRARLAALPVWDAPSIHNAVTGVAEAEGLAVAGRAVSPPIDVTLTLLGREKTLARLDAALEHIRKQAVTA